MSIPTNPPAGWYQDPSGGGRQRWFDGNQWTEHYQGGQAGLAVPVVQQIIVQGPPAGAARKARDKAVYIRQQKGHSLTMFLLIDWITCYMRTIYYTVSPNHYWHT